MQAILALEGETRELGVAAGLQDIVIQTYKGLMYMDFSRDQMERQGYGIYECMDPQLLPMVYVAYRTSLSEGTEVFHANLGERWRAGDTEVVEATKTWASYAEEGRDWLIRRDYRRLDFLINANFDLRARIYPIDRGILEIMHTARGVGATSKFAGSGGAIVGTCRDEEMLQRLVAAMARIDVVVIRPKIVQSAAARTPLGVVVPDAPVRLLAAV